MAATNVWRHFLNNRSSIQSFFLDQWEMAHWYLSGLTILVGEKKVTYFNEVEVHLGCRAYLQATKELK